MLINDVKIILYIIICFLSGSIMYSVLIPRIFFKKDVCKENKDHNPGSSSVFSSCGVGAGLLCLTLDLLKGFVPVFLGTFFIATNMWYFSFVMVAPVLGHAIAPFNRFHGGKCIATAFGVLLGVLPITYIVFILAFFYIFFSIVIKIYPVRKRSIITFALFGALAMIVCILFHKYAIAVGCLLTSTIVIIRHLRWFCYVVDENLVEDA